MSNGCIGAGECNSAGATATLAGRTPLPVNHQSSSVGLNQAMCARDKAFKQRARERVSAQALNSGDLRVWQHPTLAKAIEVLEVFSIEPGDGKLAASLVLACDQLAKQLKRVKGDSAKMQSQATLATRDRAFEWLKEEVDSAAYTPNPARSTDQIDRALNCALLLLCAQLVGSRLPQQTRKKACGYVRYMSEQGWPRDDLLPFVVSWLEKPPDLVACAKQHLSDQIGRWRAHADLEGIAFALMRCTDELDESVRTELAATMKAQFSTSSADMSGKAWGLLALSGHPETADADLDSLAESLFDDLAQDRLVNSEIAPTLRLVSQFPFSAPDEMAHHVQKLKQRGYGAASRITRVNGDGVLIDLFQPRPDRPWSFAVSATQVAFVAYVLIATGYCEIVGFPAHCRRQLERSVEKYAELQAEKVTTIPVRYVKWYNIFTVLVTLEFGAVIGALVAVLDGREWLNGCLVGIAVSAIISMVNVLTQDFVVVGMWEPIRKQLENLLGAVGRR